MALSFLAPGFLILGAAVALTVVALHVIARRRPRTSPLPTARFIPEREVEAPSRSIWPTDLLLLAARVATVLLVATAFAGPVWSGRAGGTVHIVALDVSRAVASPDEALDSVRAVAGDRAVLVAFDTVARVTPLDSAADSTMWRGAPGSLAVGLIAALREARALAERADTVTLAIVSPFVRESWDGAVDSLRALWPGPVRIVRVAPADEPGGARDVEIRSGADDPLRPTVSRVAPRAGSAARIVRDGATADDSAWTRQTGGVLVVWPRVSRETADTTTRADGVWTGTATLVAPFRRDRLTSEGRAVARWADGAPAAIEQAHGAGCVRAVGVGVPEAGDLVLQPAFRRFVERLVEPCGGAPSLEPVDSARLAGLAALAAPVRGPALARAGAPSEPLVRWLLAAALALALLELALRRRWSRA